MTECTLVRERGNLSIDLQQQWFYQAIYNSALTKDFVQSRIIIKLPWTPRQRVALYGKLDNTLYDYSFISFENSLPVMDLRD